MKRLTTHPLLALTTFAILTSVVPSATSFANAQAGESTPLKFDRLEPSLDKIVPAGATMERIVSGFTWIEGPVWAKDRLFFAEIPSNSIRTWTSGKAGTQIFLQPSGYKGSAPYGGPESGSNGMTL